jgi:hypothetical protein
MSDIVERLREYATNCGGPPEEYLTWQAADEIERLRAELAEEREAWHGMSSEIERLRKERDAFQAGLVSAVEEIGRLKRLRAGASK